jgi:hypothetical protein
MPKKKSSKKLVDLCFIMFEEWFSGNLENAERWRNGIFKELQEYDIDRYNQHLLNAAEALKARVASGKKL